ncbi:GDP-mannose 4,6-dehydratase [Legionella tunisiensis]|uniref:GDP-mannose 4,6-dehydratase n=1 Tax=Legionella tunisiensis TaxID=1034944 RepID=UPI002FBE5D33
MAYSRRDLCNQKITRGLARIKCGLEECLYLGNINAKRDWGHAKDYVEMQWLMLQQEKPEDFVIATGEQHSVREFINLAAKEINLELHWEGEGINEKAYSSDGVCRIAIDPRYFRPTEVETLLGDASKARQKLGWKPRIQFHELVEEMIRADYEIACRDKFINENGYGK